MTRELRATANRVVNLLTLLALETASRPCRRRTVSADAAGRRGVSSQQRRSWARRLVPGGAGHGNGNDAWPAPFRRLAPVGSDRRLE
jgi:hypothetical protein